MDFNKPPIVDLSKAIKIPDVRLNELLAQHAERLSELNVEDLAPAHHLAYLFVSSALAEPGMRLITMEMQGSTTAIINADDWVIIALNCRPSGADDWEHVTNEVLTAMDEAAKLIYELDYNKEPLERDGNGPHHGPHYVVHMGTGMGGGQEQPMPFTLHHSVLAILTALFLHCAIARFVGMANGKSSLP
ncbi:hypothetical protein B0H13DRAFT_2683589 [Mycena leptocephala]|nr:hypothetical protein B0H13DRAFT_2683589 [Mycena leptocephala]